MKDQVKDKPVNMSLGEDGHNPLYQDIARFRAILFDSLLKPHDMTMSQGWVLVHLLRENGLRQSELAERLEVFPLRITQLAHGLPVGGELDYLDEGTLAQALRARRPVG